MTLANVVAYAAAQGIGVQGEADGTDQGVSLFMGSMPADIKTGVLFRESGGPTDPYLQDIHRMTFQATVRGSDYPTAENLARQLAGCFRGLSQTTFGSAYFYRVYPTHEPSYFGREESGVYVFVVNFDAMWRQ